MAIALERWILVKAVLAIHISTLVRHVEMLCPTVLLLTSVHFSCLPRHLFPDYDYFHVACRAKWDKVMGVDHRAVIHEMNAANGIEEVFKKGEAPYEFKAPRLATPADD
jgi:hypothetical protein